MKPFFLIVLLLTILLSTTTKAQVTDKTISGVVKDSQNEAVPGALIRLLNAADSVLILGTATDTNGKFIFKNLTNKQYRLSITSLGNNPYTSGPLTINEQHARLVLPVIILTPAKTVLKEVLVIAKRLLIEQDLDKTIVNVDAIMGSAGNNALEVLEKTPGVTVGTGGEINLNGSGEVLVLMDGRPTYLARQDLALYLKSLPGGALDKIELMTNPPAKYDAAGSAIINIRLKKNKLPGLTGNIATGYNQGVTSRSNNMVNLNYKYKKINLFGNIGYSLDGNESKDIYNRRFYDADFSLQSRVALQNHYRYSSQGTMARVGMDYAASANTVYGFTLNLQNRPRQDQLHYIGQSLNSFSILDSTSSGSINGDYTWRNVGVNFNYQHQFSKAGREITADADYIQYKANGTQEILNLVAQADGTISSRNEFLYQLPSRITIYTAKADYQHPLSNKAKLDAGFKSSIVTNNNQSEYYQVIENTTTLDNSQSNHFIYRENLNAAYVSARKDWQRIAAQVGLRLENTLANGRQLGNVEVAGSSFAKNYTGIFPNVSFRFKIDSTGRHAVNMSIARRINRPSYQQLNPFLFYRDNYSYTSGNPLLNPQYNYVGELKYQYGQILNIGFRYGYFTNLIFTTTQAQDNIFITRPENIARGLQMALSANVSLAPTTWWRFNTTLTFAHLAIKGGLYTQNLRARANVARLNTMHQFKFNQGWSGELLGFYESKDLAGQTIINSRYRVNAALQKEILKNKATFRLIAEDIFHSWKQRDKTLSLQQAESNHINESDTQRMGVAFTYRFGKDNLTRKRKHTSSAADEEKNRAEE